MHLQVLFCSTETGRSSFVRQLEPDWHIDTNPEILFQLAVCFLHMPRFEFVFEIFFIKHHLSSFFFFGSDLSNISFMFLLLELNGRLQMCSVLHPWNSSSDAYDVSTHKT
jgi:hypothetical protein